MLLIVFTTTWEIQSSNVMCLLFRFVREQIGFEVLLFGPAGPDIAPGRCTFLSIFLLVLESPDFKSRKLSAIFA